MDDKPFPTELRPLARLMDQAHPPLVIVVGTGVTIGATSQPRASWYGLIEHGINHLVATKFKEEAGRAYLEKLQQAFAPFNLDAALDAAQDIEHNLNYPDARAFAVWLESVFKDLKAHDDKKATLDALRDLEQAGALLLTTNYDSLLEDITSLPAVTWEEHDDFLRVMRRERRGILHVHGHWQRPSSIVLGRDSYNRVVADTRIQELLKSLWLTKHWLYVGCGNGLDDPNLGALLMWSKNWGAGLEDYFLAQESVAAAIDSRAGKPSNLKSIGYPTHDDLPDWLRFITPTARCWPFVPVDDEFQFFRIPGSDIPFPTRREYLDGDVPTLAADVEVEQRLQTHGWACVMDVASVGKTTLALRLATSHGQRQQPVFYLDLKNEIPDSEDDNPVEALRRLARPGALLILDNIHHQPELARQLWQQWKHNQAGSRLLLVATRVQQQMVTTPEQDLTFFEKHPSNPAMLLQLTPDDLGRLAKHIYRRIGGSPMPEPPAPALDEWHRDYRALLNAFCLGVMAQLAEFRKGKWSIPISVAATWVEEKWLKKLSAAERENVICLAAFGAQELEILVQNEALPHPGEVRQLFDLGLVAQTKLGKLVEYRHFSLREPGWGRFILEAANIDDGGEEIRFAAAVRHPIVANLLSARLKRKSQLGEYERLWDALADQKTVFSTRLLDAGLITASCLLREAKSARKDDLLQSLWQTIESQLNKFAKRAWETSLKDVGSFLKIAQEQKRDTVPLWDALIGKDGDADRQDKLSEFAERAWETSLEHVGSFLEVAKKQGCDTVPLWDALIGKDGDADRQDKLDKFAARAWETQLDGIGSFLKMAQEQKRDTAPLWQVLERDPVRLARRGANAAVNELVGFFHHAPAAIIEITLRDIEPGHWDSIPLSEGMRGATWLAHHYGNAGQDDLASDLINLLLRRGNWRDFPPQSGGFAQACWLLAHAPSDANELVETFLKTVCTETWLVIAYSQTPCGHLASGLQQLALHQAEDRIRQFLHKRLNGRLNDELTKFNTRETNQQQSQIIQFFGCAWLIGGKVWAQNLDNISPVVLPLLLPHRPEAEGVEEYQWQFWIGLRAYASITRKPLPATRELLEETLRRWRVNLAETSAAPMSTEHLINQSMVTWLENALRAKPIALLPAAVSGRWWVPAMTTSPRPLVPR